MPPKKAPKKEVIKYFKTITIIINYLRLNQMMNL